MACRSFVFLEKVAIVTKEQKPQIRYPKFRNPQRSFGHIQDFSQKVAMRFVQFLKACCVNILKAGDSGVIIIIIIIIIIMS